MLKRGSSPSADVPVTNVTWMYKEGQEGEMLLEQYQSWSWNLALAVHVGQSPGREDVIGAGSSPRSSQTQGQLGSEFMDHQCQGDSRIRCLQRCPRKTVCLSPNVLQMFVPMMPVSDVGGVTLQIAMARRGRLPGYEEKSFEELKMESKEDWDEASQLALLYTEWPRPVHPQCRSALFGK